jgi:hypothetical protein
MPTTEDSVAKTELIFQAWYQCVQRDKFQYFDTLTEYIKEPRKLVSNCKNDVMTKYISEIQGTFEEYFLPNSTDNNWIRNSVTGSFQIEDFAIDDMKSCNILRMIRFQSKNFLLFQAFGPA